MQSTKVFCTLTIFFLMGCPGTPVVTEHPDITYTPAPVSTFWKSATVYFLLTDRFNNGNPDNDLQFERKPDGAVLRNFEGGDMTGITRKIEDGYFDSLGVDVIWFTPVFEQIKSHTDEGTGKTYAYHGYWTRDWTALDPNFGTEEDLRLLVSTAHEHGIRILLDAVINHTGPVTPIDTKWPVDWVRTDSTCRYQDYASTVECMLVDNLPDIRTESTVPVEVPEFLQQKWKTENRLQQEISELDAFFKNTNYPHYPFYYIVKWLADWVKKLGIDGFRVDTAKHTEAYVWSVLKKECEKALNTWREEHKSASMHNDPFYMVGEVYNYGLSEGKEFDYGDQKVDFFSHGFESLINFEFKYDAKSTYDSLFTKYSTLLNAPSFQNFSVLNYLASHDDGAPFDKERNKTFETATKLLLSPGAVQIYYGDETARPLEVEGASGDANLRSMMNWDQLSNNEEIKSLHQYWQKLGQFRRRHPAIGAGLHEVLSLSPYTFSRKLNDGDNDRVIIGLDHPVGEKIVPVEGVFPDGTQIKDAYSGQTANVKDGKIQINSTHTIVLLERI